MFIIYTPLLLLPLLLYQESELLSFRLKTENTERSSGDFRLKATQLAERYTEAQKEISHLQDLNTELNNKLTKCIQEKEEYIQSTKDIEKEKLELLEQFNTLQDEYQLVITKNQEILTEINTNNTIENKKKDDIIVQLQAELSSTIERMRLDASSAGNLDNYKKKAQLALKKVGLVYIYVYVCIKI